MQKQKQADFHQITDYIESAQLGSFSVVNIRRTSKKEIQFLRDEFSITAADLNDTLPALQRPKIIVRPEYIFMVLIFPVEDMKTLSIRTAKVDLFVYPDILVIVHDDDLPPMQILRQEIEHYTETHKRSGLSPSNIVPWITTELYSYCMPISNRLANAIDQIEEKIFSEDLGNRKIVKDLFTIEREVVDFRKIMRSHTMIMDKLATILPDFSKGKTQNPAIQDMIEYPRVLWTNLEAHVEAIDTLRQTYESLSSFYLNDILKNLTIFTVVIAPMTMVASIFGMNFLNIPLKEHPHGFGLTVLFMILLSGSAFTYFKAKKWI